VTGLDQLLQDVVGLGVMVQALQHPQDVTVRVPQLEKPLHLGVLLHLVVHSGRGSRTRASSPRPWSGWRTVPLLGPTSPVRRGTLLFLGPSSLVQLGDSFLPPHLSASPWKRPVCVCLRAGVTKKRMEAESNSLSL